jgi:phenylacetic acid degradation protein
MKPRVYSFEGITPVIDPTAFVHPSAVLIGDVIIGPRCFVGACATLRGDFGRIELRLEANFQDNCVAHSLPDFDCVMDERSHIGHGAVIHGCYIGKGALIGMNAVIMDRARVGDFAIVAAMSFVKIEGVVPPRVLVSGIPARPVRDLTDADLARKSAGTDQYVLLAARSNSGMVETDALTAPEPNRKRSHWVFD